MNRRPVILRPSSGRPPSRKYAAPATPAATAIPARKPRECPFRVVAVGASAGGYEAFTQFLEALPADLGMAFVFVQHLDPTHESKLTELLARTTRLPVLEVTKTLPVRRGRIYVIPPNKYLAMAGGRLKLIPRQKSDVPHMPIDLFFRTLAEDQGHNAIGVVLSGNGSDGTLGLEAIKGADGLAFAQDPKTAKFSGMPRSAIASGCVDLVLPPAAIARELANSPHHPYLAAPPAEKAEETVAEPSLPYAKIFSQLRSATGVDFSRYKQTTLKRRILRRMFVHRIDKLENYVRLLQTSPSELGKLFEDVLITVTRFFREPDSFQLLRKKVFPALMRDRRRGAPIRIWVPGCASGEEAYSIVISLVEFLGPKTPDVPIQIFGTDISEPAIARARAGLYRGNIALDVSPERLRRFFAKADDSYRISKSIRDLCVFARQDLCADPPFSNLDLISCQNVLIYFGPELQNRVIPVFHYALKPHGALLLSPAESIAGFSELFTSVEKKRRLYLKRSSLPQTRPAMAPPFFMAKAESLPATEPARAPEPLLPNIERAVDQLLLRRYTPDGVVIDDRMQVVQFRGSTAPYLEPAPGTASLNLLQLVAGDLAAHLRRAIASAVKQHTPVRQEISLRRAKGPERKLTLEVVPFQVPPAKESFCLVLFEPLQSFEAAETSARPETGTRARGHRQRAQGAEGHRLHRELEATRDSLRAIIEEQEATNEELKAANEEIQSTNEEVQSTNEELETSKEELQSTNEELQTVNEELQHSNLEVNRANNDLNNLLASVQIPVIMVENNLAIRRFTPAAQKFFNLIPADVGRSLSDIKVSFDVADLDRMILEVIETLQPREREVRDRAGHWHSLRIRPYRTKDNTIDGAVLALIDIDQLKRSLEQMIEMVWDPFLALEGDLRVARANEAFYEKFLTSREETEGQFVYQLGNGQWNIPRLRCLLEEVLPQKAVIRDFAVDHDFPKIGHRKMLLNARRLDPDKTGKEIILVAIRDAPPPVKP